MFGKIGSLQDLGFGALSVFEFMVVAIDQPVKRAAVGRRYCLRLLHCRLT